eukprot:5386353-Pleurochrysis_carterae.AAC.2
MPIIGSGAPAAGSLSTPPSHTGRGGGSCTTPWSLKVSRLNVAERTVRPCDRRQISISKGGINVQVTFTTPLRVSTPFVDPYAVRCEDTSLFSNDKKSDMRKLSNWK